ncbi:MAG TPA: S8 family serine peptidase [Polyangia bacterium]|nr:S8 family serine peptidase [Polyangia bacterium]
MRAIILGSLFVLLALPAAAGPQEGQAGLYYRSADGPTRITRHPRLVCAVVEGEVQAAIGRIRAALAPAPPAIGVRQGPAGLSGYGVTLLEVRAADARGMARAFAAIARDPAVGFAEPVYLIGGVVPLYPHPLLAVGYEDGVPLPRVEALVAALGGEVRFRAPWNERLLFLAPPRGVTSLELANRYDRLSETRFGAPDFLVERVPRYLTDDPRLDDQWHLIGGSGAAADADVRFDEALDLAYGTFPLAASPTLVVGVCDTGVLVDHEDLRVTAGYDMTGSAVGINPDDNQDGHGTSVAGVAAGVGDNGLGVSGGCPTCGVVGIKLDLPGVVSEGVLAMTYYSIAAEEDIPALNNSWGLDTPWIYVPMSQTMKEGIDTFSNTARGGKGGVIVFASGNSNQLAALDGSTGYVRTLTVGASTCESKRASYSNFGHAVDVLAPSNGDGCGITTTSMSSTSGYTGNFGGTSSAAPLVTGIVGLMVAANPELTEAQIREGIIRSAVPIDEAEAAYGPSPILPGDEDVVFSWTHAHGRVDARRAVEVALAYGASGCTIEYELCNGIDDDCDGSTDDEYDACNPCLLDSQSNGREFCGDGIDNDCDGLTDPETCIEPCEDLKGLCNACENGASCWPGLDCSYISMNMDETYCLKRCLDSTWCPEGYWCETYWSYTCIPDGFSCEGKAEEIPDPSCIEEPDAGPDGGPDADTDGDTDTDTDPDAGPAAKPASGCGCTAGGSPADGLLALLLRV